MPFESKYKFYIIDEAHALTKDAWGALLKTLEEPPAHVVFVLATTELDRVPETIQSRCQVFRFKTPSHETLKSHGARCRQKRRGLARARRAELIALVGEGSFRDTLGVLQKALTISEDKKLSEEEIAKVVGAPQGGLINNFLSALAKKDAAGAIGTFHKAIENGSEPAIFSCLRSPKSGPYFWCALRRR